jgi:hypothetical protein
MEDKNLFIDELLNSALARQKAEPRPGLEARILERTRTDASRQASKNGLWKFWVAVTAAAAVVMMITGIHMVNRSHSPAAQKSRVSNAVPPPPPQETLTARTGTIAQLAGTTVTTKPKRTTRHEGRPTRLMEAEHWPSQFPSPAPLTSEQKALVQYVRNTPPQVLATSPFKEQSADQPLEIKPLKIAPVEILPLTTSTTEEEFQ